MRRLLRSWSALLPAAALAAGLAAVPEARADTLRVVPQADLQNLDPIWTTAIITSNHAYMVYDVLFAADGDLQQQPQMVESYDVSDDRLLWTFTLRDGLLFHDGSPVTATDVVDSTKRWAQRMSAGQTLFRYVDEITAIDERSFELRLTEPFGPVLEALGNPGNPNFIMRSQEAATDPYEQIAEVVGSGPFVFDREVWQPGNIVTYQRFAEYQPREEEASGFAGGKIAHFEQVDWIYLPDPNTAASALLTGEVDILDKPPTDLFPIMEQNPDVVIRVINMLGDQAMVRPNHLIPPFDNPKMREMLLYVVGDQADHLAAMVGMPDLRKPCWAIFGCDVPLAVEDGIGEWNRADRDANMARARELLQEAGYNGERVVIMDPTDFQIIHNMTLVTAQRLRDIGVNVDLQAMDWSSLTSRRPVREHPDVNPGGWHLFHTYSPGGYVADPLANGSLSTNCDQSNWFGWPCDDELEEMRLQFAFAVGEERVELARRFQERYYQIIPYAPVGTFLAPVAYRSDIDGVLDAERLNLWNVHRVQ